MNHIKTIARFLLGFPLTLAAFYFIGGFILQHGEEVETNFQKLNVPLLLGGFIFLFFFFVFRSITWNKLLEKEGYTTSPIESTYLLAISEIKRYIPGSVIALISRVKNFNTFKVSSKTTMKLIFYESVIFLITSIITSVPAIIYLFETKHLGKYVNPTLLTVVLLVLLAIGGIYYLLPKKHAQKVADVLFGLYKYRGTFIYMLVAWILYGTGNYFIGSSLHILNPNKIVELSSLFSLSWLVGYIVIIAPLGLGVREAVITFGLSTVVPLPIAAAISIATRVALVFGEVIFLTISFGSYKFIKKNK